MQISAGELIDKLIVTNIKIFMLEDRVTAAMDAGDDLKVGNLHRTGRALNTYRNQLISEISARAGDPGQTPKTWGS